MQNNQNIAINSNQTAKQPIINDEIHDYNTVTLKRSLELFDKCLSPKTPHWKSKDTLNHKPVYLVLRQGLIEPKVPPLSEFMCKEDRTEYAYLKYSSDYWQGAIIIDIDLNISNQIESIIKSNKDMPLPNLIIKNPKNGHVQLYYCLRNAVCLNTEVRGFHKLKRFKPKAYNLLGFVKKRLKEIFNADFSHHNRVAKNPYFSGWDVSTMRSDAYQLKELAVYTGIYDYKEKGTLFNKSSSRFKKLGNKKVALGQRNDWLFNVARLKAYEVKKGRGKDWTKSQFLSWLVDFMNELNSTHIEIQLQNREVRSIANSITKYCFNVYLHSKFKSEELTEIAKKLGKLGGVAKGKSYSKQRNRALKLHKNGLTPAAIQSKTNLSRSLVYSLIKKYRLEIRQNRKVLKIKAVTRPNSYQYGRGGGSGYLVGFCYSPVFFSFILLLKNSMVREGEKVVGKAKTCDVNVCRTQRITRRVMRSYTSCLLTE